MRECWRVMAHKISVLISSRGCILLLLLVLLILLNLLHRCSETLQKMHLGGDELFHIRVRWWWWYLLTMLVPVVVRSLASVHHLIG
jgi:fumarate reductase subunit D